MRKEMMTVLFLLLGGTAQAAEAKNKAKVAAEPCEVSFREEELKPVFDYLLRYWGAAQYTRNFALFQTKEGQPAKVVLLPRCKSRELFNRATRDRRRQAAEEHRGFTHAGRVFVVHDGMVSPFAEAATILHELDHLVDYRSDRQHEVIEAEGEARAKRTLLAYMERILGAEWLRETRMAVKNTAQLRWAADNRPYYVPSERAVQVLQKRLRERGIEEGYSDVLAGWVSTLANEKEQLVLYLVEIGYNTQ